MTACVGGGVMYAKHMSASDPLSGPLQIQSVVDQVYDAVRARILSGDLPRGSRLRQAALADELGVSRTPLREALRRLATEGLVEFEANRGATVADHDFADERQSWLARIALEPGAARLAAERRDPEAIAAMRGAIARPAGGRAATRRRATTSTAASTSRSSPEPATRTCHASPRCSGRRSWAC